MTTASVPYTRGLHQLTGTCYAWLVPDGTWGWSNSRPGSRRGPVAAGGHALFDLAMTREMLARASLRSPTATRSRPW